MADNVFGTDSSSDEDTATPAAPAQTASAPPSSNAKKSEHDIFGTDSESDNESDEDYQSSNPKRRRLTKGGKKAKKSDKKEKSAYDDETDFRETAEDRNFIASDDDAELVAEYGYRQQFDDREVDHEFEDSGRAPRRSAPSGNSRPRKSGGKKGGRVEISKLDAEEKAQEVLLRMETAAREDREFYLAKKPAIHKIKLLDWAVARLRNRLYQAAFLEFNLCGVLEQWLQPLPDKSLCNSTIRRKLYAVLGTLAIEQQHLINCGLGKVLMKNLKSPKETLVNKVKIKGLIEKWMRPIFNKSANFKDQPELEHDERDPEQRRQRMQSRNNMQDRQEKSENLQVNKRLKPGDPGFKYYTARPQPVTMEYKKRLKMKKIKPLRRRQSEKKKSIKRRLLTLRRQANAGLVKSSVKMSIEGRGM